jgi:hypothetical protein
MFSPDGQMDRMWVQWFNYLTTVTAGIVVGGVAGNFVKLGVGGSLVDSGKVAPSGVVVGDTDLQNLTNKTLGTRHQDNLASRIADEDVTGAWRMPKRPSRTLSGASVSLTSSDFGKIIKMDNAGLSVTCTLPSVGTSDVDSWVTIFRLGTGPVSIKAADADVIEKSRAGGSLVCSEAGRVAANVTLYLATETTWAIIAGTGIWIAN